MSSGHEKHGSKGRLINDEREIFAGFNTLTTEILVCSSLGLLVNTNYLRSCNGSLDISYSGDSN